MHSSVTLQYHRSRPFAVFLACSAIAFAAGSACAESYEFNFDFPNRGSGRMYLEADPGATSIALASSPVFEAQFEVDGQVWTQADYQEQTFNADSLGMTKYSGDGSDWAWNDSDADTGAYGVARFNNGVTELSFDEGDEGSRVYRINGVEAGDYSASTAGDAPPTPEPAPRAQPNINAALQGIATNPNAESTAGAIATACPASVAVSPDGRFTQDCSAVVGGALSPSTSIEGQASVALSSVTAEQATVSLSSSRASLSTQRQNLSTRLAALRGGAMGVSMQGLTFDVDGQGFGAAALAGMPASSAYGGGAASADSGPLLVFGDDRIGAFINGTVSSGNKDATINEDGFDFTSWGITAGVDYRFKDNMVFGFGAGYGKNNTDIDNRGGSLDTDAYSFSLYGTYYIDSRFYVDGILTYGNNSYTQKRNITYQIAETNLAQATSVSQTASADYDGSQWSGALGGGYQMTHDEWNYGPTLRLEYISASVDGYGERMSNPSADGGGWAANLNKLDQDSFTSSLGFDASRAISTDYGVLLPQVNLSWVHEYKNSPIAVDGFFIEDPTRSRFNIEGDRPDTDYFTARLGFSAQLAGGTTAFLYYNKVFGYKNLDVDTLGAGIRLTF